MMLFSYYEAANLLTEDSNANTIVVDWEQTVKVYEIKSLEWTDNTSFVNISFGELRHQIVETAL